MEKEILLEKIKKIEIENETVNKRNQILEIQNQFLEERVKLLEHKLFGPSKETRKSEKELIQDSLFNEAEIEIAKADAALAKEQETATEETVEVPAHTRKKSGRKPLPENLPRVERVIDIPKEERVCPHDNTQLKRIGEEVSEKLNVVPARIEVIKTIRPTYACPCCESHIVTASLPKEPFAKGFPTAATAAYVIIGKYADGLPLYRQSKMFERLGIELGRATLANWMIESANILKPIYDAIRDSLVELNVLHADETRVQVLKETGRKAETLSYMWALASPYQSKVQAAYFEYHETRSGKAAQHLLSGFKGRLICDGFDGYEVLTKSDIIRHGCWAHARRKFDEVLKASKKGAGVADQLLTLIGKLYDIERTIRNLTDNERGKIRRTESQKIIDEIKEKLDATLPGVVPQSALARALNYLNNEWCYLIKFIDDPNVAIDNNRLENAIRPFALGRKNWLFACTPNGAHASATLYSIIESAKLNSHNPFEYVKALLEEIPKLDVNDDFTNLMPWNWKHIPK